MAHTISGGGGRRTILMEGVWRRTIMICHVDVGRNAIAGGIGWHTISGLYAIAGGIERHTISGVEAKHYIWWGGDTPYLVRRMPKLSGFLVNYKYVLYFDVTLSSKTNIYIKLILNVNVII